MTKPLKDELLKDNQIIYSNKDINVTDKTGKVEDAIALINELKTSGEWQRFNAMLDKKRADRNLEK
ncbi:hypothetical protein [Myroides marinus]|uniref:hypothetical protein n=1 Tax=Myroides marinus TaxID=703342 RepID=UPI0025760184|nr:hypothetical protein [Myroides marinus]MDM1360592.1 hypothetical protein [Myroides marinus]